MGSGVLRAEVDGVMSDLPLSCIVEVLLLGLVNVLRVIGVDWARKSAVRLNQARSLCVGVLGELPRWCGAEEASCGGLLERSEGGESGGLRALADSFGAVAGETGEGGCHCCSFDDRMPVESGDGSECLGGVEAIHHGE